MKSLEYLWSDRRRRLGLPLSLTRYSLSEDRLFLETGLLSTRCEEILLYRVRDLSMKISLGQRIFGVGTVTVQSSDKSCPVLELRNIKHPRETKEIIHQAVEQMKLQRRMRVGEVMGDDYHHDDMEDDHMDDDWE
ncbi:MAG: PH domain-containing protein [Oscillospiraceae bacterium]|nr:PH domain-containing protein [Oscillospiraceae bacterium]